MSRILIIGAGLSGMASALMLHEAGHTVTIISRGLGGMLLANGTIDILGWHAKIQPNHQSAILPLDSRSFSQRIQRTPTPRSV
ncbi:FAD-binding protein [Arcanobacterium hippocoleae]|uniref:FAD-binding protein n=1 Tax=Arcanobacterium hippocoleae TaxID=149017 RepID=UPI003341EF9F